MPDLDSLSSLQPLNLPDLLQTPNGIKLSEDEAAALKDLYATRGWGIFRDRIVAQLLENHERAVLTLPDDVRYYQGAYWSLCQLFNVCNNVIEPEAVRSEQENDEYWEGF